MYRHKHTLSIIFILVVDPITIPNPVSNQFASPKAINKCKGWIITDPNQVYPLYRTVVINKKRENKGQLEVKLMLSLRCVKKKKKKKKLRPSRCSVF